MTESEWLEGEKPSVMLCLLREAHKVTRTKSGRRRLHLFAAACSFRVYHVLPRVSHESVEDALRIKECFAEGKAAGVDLGHAMAQACKPIWRLFGPIASEETKEKGRKRNAARAVQEALRREAWQAAKEASYFAAWALPGRAYFSKPSQEELAQGRLLHCLFGNPFRPVHIDESWLRWNDGTIPKMAQAIYEERRFGDLPVLADALEEAGATDEQILHHCRGPGPHARGCFVMDALLSKR